MKVSKFTVVIVAAVIVLLSYVLVYSAWAIVLCNAARNDLLHHCIFTN